MKGLAAALLVLGLSGCGSPYQMADGRPESVMACVAELTGLPNPGVLPKIIETTRAELNARRAAGYRYGEFYQMPPNGLIVVATDAPIRESRPLPRSGTYRHEWQRRPVERHPLAHELTHYLQWRAGQDPTGWKQEKQAQWVERRFDAWCR